MNDFKGEFETHITVLVRDQDFERLRNWATARNLKLLHIVLDRGAQSSQPMLSNRARGSLPEQLQAATALAAKLAADGFDVARIKIEAGPTNADIPQDDSSITCEHAECYFEHHVKLLLSPDIDFEELKQIAERHTAHLSRNALSSRADGEHERFVTQRCFGVGNCTASRRLAALLTEFYQRGYRVVDIEEEYVVFDSNAAVDAGWISA